MSSSANGSMTNQSSTTIHAQKQLTSGNFPKIRENIWHIAEHANPDDATYLITATGQYELPARYTKNFLKIRPFCTGHHSISSISAKTDVSADEILAFIDIFEDIGLLYSETPLDGPLEPAKVRDSLVQIVKIWANELHSVYIANELALDGLSKSILVGWMLEMYHYVLDFPAALRVGANHARGELKDILDRYASEEEGHEEFILQTLINLGLNEAEVKTSVPLVSTRCIGFLLRELLELEPEATLLAAALLEAADFDDENIAMYKKRLSELYAVPENALDPYFEHQKIDYDLGHQRLLLNNLDSIKTTDPHRLDQIVNKLHDLKHAFELQSLEIKSYYGDPLNGRYVPRQRMLYACI